ncbi:hypothetical protein Zmor_013923 [Zophobas morio]|uniref:Uncharacterized protein n=1 Tax=Zophobas morio TaxID=2755281 RepID=A0AA38MF52_9CUCU|nr:hypothetical protein Zmor_013923 [Zophobas morio]
MDTSLSANTPLNQMLALKERLHLTFVNWLLKSCNTLEVTTKRSFRMPTRNGDAVPGAIQHRLTTRWRRATVGQRHEAALFRSDSPAEQIKGNKTTPLMCNELGFVPV